MKKALRDGVAASMIFGKENLKCLSRYDLHIKSSILANETIKHLN